MPDRLRLVAPLPRCAHTERRGLTWACSLLAHGPDRAHVLRAIR